MKKILISLFTVIIFTIYVAIMKNPDFFAARNQSPTTPQNYRSTQNQPVSPPPQSVTVKNNAYNDGTYTGSVADAYYGNMQVQTIIQNGKITDVQFLQYPSDRDTSIRINTEAMPILKTEVIQSQNASVDIVSGATQTSNAFVESLASALSRAKT